MVLLQPTPNSQSNSPSDFGTQQNWSFEEQFKQVSLLPSPSRAYIANCRLPVQLGHLVLVHVWQSSIEAIKGMVHLIYKLNLKAVFL